MIERVARSGDGVCDIVLLRFGDIKEALLGGRGGYSNAGAAGGRAPCSANKEFVGMFDFRGL
jgi:hypothetical protein